MAFRESEHPPVSEVEAVRAAVERITEEHDAIDAPIANSFEEPTSPSALEPAIVGLAQYIVATQEGGKPQPALIKKLSRYGIPAAVGAAATLGITGMIGSWASSSRETNPKAATLAMFDTVGSIKDQAIAMGQNTNAAARPHHPSRHGKHVHPVRPHEASKAAQRGPHQVREMPRTASAASVQTPTVSHNIAAASYGGAPTRSIAPKASPHTGAPKPQAVVHHTERVTYHTSPTRSRSTGGASYQAAPPPISKAGGTAPSAQRRSQHSVGGGIGAN